MSFGCTVQGGDKSELMMELIFPLAARHPDPLIRLAVWQLVGEMIKKAADVRTQVVLLRQVISAIHVHLYAGRSQLNGLAVGG